MEEMKLIIAIGVPYHVEIAATGIPLHEAKVDFCIPKKDVSFSFPAKAITDNEYVFTVTDAVKEYLNTTVEYILYVYYGNARFEADTGSFNLIDKTTFEVSMKKPEKKLAETIRAKAKRRPKEPEVTEKVIEEAPEVTEKVIEEESVVEKVEPEITATPTVTNEDKKKPTFKATKPTPTPTLEVTTTLKQAKDAIKKTGKKKTGDKSGIAKILVTKIPKIEETQDANARVKDILESINKTVTPNTDLATATTSEEPDAGGNFLEEVEKMRKAQAVIKQNKKAKANTQRVRDAIKKAEGKSKSKK